MLVVNRFIDSGKQTIGKLSLNGNFICFTLEDTFREEKVYGETRIPSGIYDLKIREYGGHHEKYKNRFPLIHAGMVQVMNVPNFTDILIHCGNDESHTMGCLLLGNEVMEHDGLYRLGDSSTAYVRAYSIIKDVLGKILYYDETRYTEKEVTAQVLNVREQPRGLVKGTVNAGTKLKEYFITDGWSFTELGFTSAKYLSEV